MRPYIHKFVETYNNPLLIHLTWYISIQQMHLMPEKSMHKYVYFMYESRQAHITAKSLSLKRAAMGQSSI